MRTVLYVIAGAAFVVALIAIRLGVEWAFAVFPPTGIVLFAIVKFVGAWERRERPRKVKPCGCSTDAKGYHVELCDEHLRRGSAVYR